MKKFYLFIDESGDFDKSQKSIVGGFVCQDPNTVLKKLTENVMPEFKKNHLGWDDVHVSEVLYTDAFPNKEKTAMYNDIPKETRRTFFEQIRNVVLEQSDFCMSVEALDFSFYDDCKQTKYGYALLGLISKVKIKLARQYEDDFRLHCRIATRSKDCYPIGQTSKEYHDRLHKLVKQKLKVEIYQDNKRLLDLADVACYYLKQNDKHGKLIRSSLTDTEVANIEERLTADLMAKGELFTAYKYAIQKEAVLNHLAQIEKEQARKQQLNLFLNHANDLTKKRKLNEVTAICEAVLKACGDDETYNAQKRTALESLMVVTNHKGETIQEDLLIAIKELVVKNQSFFERYSKVLELKNTCLNYKFNTYRFKNIVDEFKKEVDNYIENMLFVRKQSKEKDERNSKCRLLCAMCGTLGQAYAFLGDYKNAENHFEASLNHWEDKNDWRTVNYMITMYWKQGKRLKAIDMWNKYKDQKVSKENAGVVLLDLLKENKFFEVSVLIRLYHQDFDKTMLDNIKTALLNTQCKEHPIALIYKWLAVAYITGRNKCFQKANDCLNKALKINDGFALKVMAVINFALKVLCLKPTSDRWKDLENKVNNLIAQEPHIKDYLNFEALKTMMNDNNVMGIAMYLPFSYS